MIAIEISSTRIRALADVSGSESPRVWSEQFPRELRPDSALELGNWLKLQLAAASIPAGESIVLLGRGTVTLKPVSVPVVPDSELPAVVSFAVEGTGATAGRTVIDYQSGPMIPGIDGNSDAIEAFTASVSADLLDAIKRLLSTAGVPPRRIGIRPLGTRWSLPTTEGTVAIVYATDETVEVSVWTDEILRLCRSIPVTADSLTSDRIVSELRRTLASFHGQDSAADITSVTIVGESATALAQTVHASIGLPVHPRDIPRDELPILSLRAILPRARSNWPIDLLKPKRSVARTTGSRLTTLLASFAAVLVLGTGYLLFTRQLAQRDRDIAGLQSILSQTTTQLGELKPTADRHQVIRQWIDSGDPLLDELQEIAAALPDTSDLFLTSLEYNAGQNNQPGVIKIDGQSRDQSIVTQAQTRLAGATGHYDVVPRSLDPGADIGPFVWRFGLDLALMPMSAVDVTKRAARREEVLASLAPPVKMQRANLSLARSASSTDPRTTGKGKGKPDKEGKSDAKSDKKEAKADATGDAGKSGFLETKIAEIRALPAEQREEAINKVPKVFQKRVRQALEKSGS